VLEGFSFRTALKESNKARGGHSLPSFVRRVRQPELPVILLEDFGALVGLVFALVGVTLAAVTGDSRWDALGAIAVGALLIVIAVFLAMEMSAMLVGESALPEQQQAIEQALEASPLISSVIHLRTLHTGPDQLLVAAKIAIAGADTGAEIARGIDEAEAAIRAAVPSATYIFLEPDLLREGEDPQPRRPAGSMQAARSSCPRGCLCQTYGTECTTTTSPLTKEFPWTTRLQTSASPPPGATRSASPSTRCPA
jgi:hypothetical protein